MNTLKLKVQGMTCSGCVNRVAKTLKDTPGVVGATVLLEAGTAEVTSAEAIDAAVLIAALDKKGYPASALT